MSKMNLNHDIKGNRNLYKKSKSTFVSRENRLTHNNRIYYNRKVTFERPN